MSEAARHVVCPACATVNRVAAGKPAAAAKCGSCHAPLFPGKPLAADLAGFDRHLQRDEIPLVVDFWAPWCGPCRAMAPAFERAAAELEPRFRLLKVDTEAVPELAMRYGIQSIPTMMVFSGGRPVAQTAGARDARAIVAWVEANAPRG